VDADALQNQIVAVVFPDDLIVEIERALALFDLDISGAGILRGR
jgi:hypothetical protein